MLSPSQTQAPAHLKDPCRHVENRRPTRAATNEFGRGSLTVAEAWALYDARCLVSTNMRLPSGGGRRKASNGGGSRRSATSAAACHRKCAPIQPRRRQVVRLLRCTSAGGHAAARRPHWPTNLEERVGVPRLLGVSGHTLAAVAEGI
jgi:hypothetical protein